MNRPNIVVALVVVFLLLTLPFALAAFIGGREQVFIGFLANPADGITYLAKMYQGWSGTWLFQLPFSAEPGSGAYLFLFYLFLGHLARWLGLPLIIIFHLARLLGAGLLLFALARFYDYVFAGRPDLYRIAFWLTVIGSGMGWLILALGPPPTDFWVAEAYPFLAMYTNPHFPIGLALILFSFTLMLDPRRSLQGRETPPGRFVDRGDSAIRVGCRGFGDVLCKWVGPGWKHAVWNGNRFFAWDCWVDR